MISISYICGLIIAAGIGYLVGFIDGHKRGLRDKDQP